MWATRILFESQLHDRNSFITLTYDDSHLPNPPTLVYKDFQDFLKRLRKKFGKLRFYMCGEYGEQTFRPHFHACIFGTDFPDRVLFKRTRGGHNLYISADLAKLWPHGNSSVAELNFDTAAYVARYCLKKVTGDPAEAHYAWTDPDTGEIHQLEPEFAHMSLKPGIGGSWYDKFRNGADCDYVVVNGHKCKPPRYFDKLLKRVNPKVFEYIKSDREQLAYDRRSDNTPERLVVREIVQLAALQQLSPRGDL